LHEAVGPLPGCIEVSEAVGRERGAILVPLHRGFDRLIGAWLKQG